MFLLIMMNLCHDVRHDAKCLLLKVMMICFNKHPVQNITNDIKLYKQEMPNMILFFEFNIYIIHIYKTNGTQTFYLFELLTFPRQFFLS